METTFIYHFYINECMEWNFNDFNIEKAVHGIKDKKLMIYNQFVQQQL